MSKLKKVIGFTVFIFIVYFYFNKSPFHLETLKTAGGDFIFSIPKDELHIISRENKFFHYKHVIKAVNCAGKIKDIDIITGIKAGNHYSYISYGKRVIASHEKAKNKIYQLDLYENLKLNPADYLLTSGTNTFIYCVKKGKCAFRSSFNQYINYRISFNEEFLSCWPDIEKAALQTINHYLKEVK